MSTPLNSVPGSHADAHVIAPARKAPWRPFFWLVRRELWENRSIYIVPLVSALLFLGTFVVHTILVRYRMHGAWPADPEKQHDLFAVPYQFAAGLIMGSAFLIGIFYCVETLYGERRDRSILFWKSMPVSDLATVLAKTTVPVVILPLLSFVITLATQSLMLLLSWLVLLGSGLGVSTLWTHASFPQFSVMLFYHIVTVHGLWYAPMYGWFLFVSSWAPRAPFVWAFLPPFLIGGMEMAIFNSTHFFNMLLRRLMGPESPAVEHATSVMQAMSAMSPIEFFAEPGLWIGLAIAAGFVAAAIRLRRSRGPV